MTRILHGSARQTESPQSRDDVSCWRHVEARVTYMEANGAGPQRLALLHTIDQGPEFRELVFMLEAWLAATQARVLDIVFTASEPVSPPPSGRLEN